MENVPMLSDNLLLDDDFDDFDDETINTADEHQQPLINGLSPKHPAFVVSSSEISIGKIKIFKPRRRNRINCRRCLSCLVAVLAVVLGAVLLFNLRDKLRFSTPVAPPRPPRCDYLYPSPVWNRTFPMLTIESALRRLDANNDSVDDVVVAFGTGCGGGIMVLDGASGQVIWKRYTPHQLLAVNCEADVTADGVNDCIVGGRMASLMAFDGATGDLIWSLSASVGEPVVETASFYTPLFISRDVDGDGVRDLVAMHGGDPLRKPSDRNRLAARLLVVSAQKGTILRWALVPDKAESYYAPQLLTRPDGGEVLLYGTGGPTQPGGLYAVALDDLLHGHLRRSVAIHKDCCKGVVAPPVLVDLNGDATADIVVALLNATVAAFDGRTYKRLWRRHFPGGETFSSPAVGYFNNDSTPDFAVTYQFGPGFPIYYRTQVAVLDGSNGALLAAPVDMLVGTQSSPLTVSTYAPNDLFLFWYSSCDVNVTRKAKTKPFKFVPGLSIEESSRADFCGLRFNATSYTQLRSLSPSSSSIVYDSRLADPYHSDVNYGQMARAWLRDHLGEYYGAGGAEGAETVAEAGEAAESSPPQPIYGEYQPQQPPPPDNPIIYDDSAINYDRQSPYGPLVRRRYRRHVGLRARGVQRVVSTGTLVSALDRKRRGSIDLVFATYWLPASRKARLMTPAMADCIARYMSPDEETRLRLVDPNSLFKKLEYDHDAYEEAVNDICSRDAAAVSPSSAAGGADGEQADGADLVREMGSMTVHRVNLKCAVRGQDKTVLTGAIRPFSEQIWPAYLGRHVNCLAP